MKNNTLFKHLWIILAIVFLASCEKNYVEMQPTLPGPTGPTGTTPTVFFAADIQPIFTAKCVDNCHATQPPVLASGSAFSSLQGTGPTIGIPYIDTSTPLNSGLYKVLLSGGFNGVDMNNYTTTITANDRTKVLTWITEGALNN